jgi:D-alanine-D-alanine ligase
VSREGGGAGPAPGDGDGTARGGAGLQVAVLMGGVSGEREVSLASGAQVVRGLRAAGLQAVAVDTSRGILDDEELSRILDAGVRSPSSGADPADILATGELAAFLRTPELEGTDLIFPILHGGAGEDGTLQGLLELADLPYAGSGRLGCTLAMDKEVSKRLFRAEGIPTPDWLPHPAEPDQVDEALGFPVIVKPPSGGSTLGLSLVRDREELALAVKEALRFEDRVLFERYVRGRELTVGVVGNQALPVGEIIPEHEIFDYECKYQPGLAREIFPAEIPEEVAERVRGLAVRVHRLLFLRDFSRVDFILDPDGELWCLEANALPGMTTNSLLPRAAQAAGWSLPDLCRRIVELAARRSLRSSRR